MIVKLFSKTINLKRLVEEGIFKRRSARELLDRPKGYLRGGKIPISDIYSYRTPGIQDCGDIFDNSDEAREIYNNYKRAMTRKRTYVYEGLMDRLDDRPFFALKDPDSMGMIIGFYEHGVFMPSHFAPTNIKNGVKLAEMSKEAATPILYAVPDDLSEMLIKTGGHTQYGQIPQPFNGKIVMKNLVGNHRFNQMLNNPRDREKVFDIIRKEHPEITKEIFDALFTPTIKESNVPNRILKDIDLEKLDYNESFGKYSSLKKNIANDSTHSGAKFQLKDLTTI